MGQTSLSAARGGSVTPLRISKCSIAIQSFRGSKSAAVKAIDLLAVEPGQTEIEVETLEIR